MKKIYIISGAITTSPLGGSFDLDAYLLDFFAKETCCTKSLSVESLETTTLSVTTISELTSGTGVSVDGVLLKDGGVSAHDMFAGFYPVSGAQALSGAGAVNVTAFHTKFTSTGGAQALTLANGTQIGQLKKISHIVDGGSGVLTPTSLTGGTTITFTTVGEFALLIWNGTSWNVIELGNTATPGTLPALA